MPSETIAYLSFVFLAFGAFAVTVAWANHRTSNLPGKPSMAKKSS